MAIREHPIHTYAIREHPIHTYAIKEHPIHTYAIKEHPNHTYACGCRFQNGRFVYRCGEHKRRK